jgi:chromosome segregation protein
MRIERLEVFGFKSFMDRLTLPMESGITGVVGPNGCGKSNIVDALRWVLGETRASQLRGGILEDVIFNGTESLRPLGLAEVSLVVRAERGSLYDDLVGYYEEVEALNPSTAPISEAPIPEITTEITEGDRQDRDSVEAIESAQSLAEAGAQIAEGVSEAPALHDSGEVVSLAANSDIVEPKAPVEITESQGEDTSLETETAEPRVDTSTAANTNVGSDDFISDIKASLSKYSWLKSVSEVQITRRLYRSGESEFFINKVQSRLKDLKDLFRVIGLAARGYTIIAQGEIGRIVTAKAEDRRQVIEEAAHIAGFREHMNAVGKRLEDTQNQVLRLEDVIKEVARQVANLKRQAGRAAARAELKTELATLERDLFTDTLGRLNRKVQEGLQRVNAMAADEQSASAAFNEARQLEQVARDEAVRVEGEIETLRRKADECKDELNKRLREVSSKESRIRELNSVLQARQTEIRRLEERKVMLEERLSDSQEALSRLEREEAQLNEQSGEVEAAPESELKELQGTLHTLREDLRNKERSIREVRDRLVSAQSRRDALQAQLTAASPLTHLKKALGGEHKIPAEITGQVRLLVDGITVPNNYAKALQAVLAERASFLVVDEVQKVAASFHDMILKNDPENKKGLGLGLFQRIDEESVHQELSEIVKGVEGAVRLPEVVQCAEWCRGLVGRLLGKVVIASTIESAFTLFEKMKGAGALDPEVVVVTEAGDLLSPWSFYSLRHEGGVVQMKIKIDEAMATLSESQELYDTLSAQRDTISTQISDGEKRHNELVRAIQSAQQRLREIANRQGEIRGRLQSERRMFQQLQQDIARIEPQGEELRNQLGILEREIAVVVEQLEMVKAVDNSELEDALAVAVAELRGREDERRKARESMGELVRGAELKRQALELLRDKITRERMNAERGRGEFTAVQNQIRQRLGEEFLAELEKGLETAELLPEPERQSLDARVTGIRQRLDREGEVDPTVIEQYEVENQRLNELISQKDDLVTAAETLRVTLGELSEACTRRFALTFEAIKKNFAIFGPKLFGGGSAELSLLDPTKPLETGVEILVRPPGKKPKSIDLLSGGEKALCATALVFAMFMVRPSPLCVLDEVDAPLDEANVHRFVSFIKEMSSKTQFLMITHNKQSMAAADTLVGVTMPTPGASKVLTVSLQEAVKQVA